MNRGFRNLTWVMLFWLQGFLLAFDAQADWCANSGLRCRLDSRSAGLISTPQGLAARRQYEEFHRHFEAFLTSRWCAGAQRRARALCRAGQLDNVLQDVTFFGENAAQAGRFTATGARLVHDCGGDHLQVDLRRVRTVPEMERLANTLDSLRGQLLLQSLAELQAQTTLPPRPRTCNPELTDRQATVRVTVREMSESGQLQPPREAAFSQPGCGACFVSLPGDHPIPRDYVSSECFRSPTQAEPRPSTEQASILSSILPVPAEVLSSDPRMRTCQLFVNLGSQLQTRFASQGCGYEGWDGTTDSLRTPACRELRSLYVFQSEEFNRTMQAGGGTPQTNANLYMQCTRSIVRIPERVPFSVRILFQLGEFQILAAQQPQTEATRSQIATLRDDVMDLCLRSPCDCAGPIQIRSTRGIDGEFREGTGYLPMIQGLSPEQSTDTDLVRRFTELSRAAHPHPSASGAQIAEAQQRRAAYLRAQGCP